MRRILSYLLFMLLILPGTVFSFNVESVSITGSVSQGYIKTTEYNFLVPDSKEGSFKFGEGLLNISCRPYDELRVGMSVAYRRLGDIGNNEPYINWAMADYSFKEWLSFRAGIMKTALGFYNETRDMDLFRTAVVLPYGVYRENFRDYFDAVEGAAIYGMITQKNIGTLKYQIMAGTDNVPADSGGSKVYSNFLSSYNSQLTMKWTDVNEDNGVLNIGLTWLTPVTGLLFNYNLYDAGKPKVDLAVGSFEGLLDVSLHRTYILGVKYLINNLTAEGEYFKVKINQSIGVTYPTGTVTLLDNFTSSVSGWYVNSTYRIFDWLEVGLYFSTHKLHKSAIAAEKNIDEICLSLRFDLAENVILKIEGHKYKDTCDEPFTIDNPGNDFSEDDWMMFASKITLSF